MWSARYISKLGCDYSSCWIFSLGNQIISSCMSTMILLVKETHYNDCGNLERLKLPSVDREHWPVDLRSDWSLSCMWHHVTMGQMNTCSLRAVFWVKLWLTTDVSHCKPSTAVGIGSISRVPTWWTTSLRSHTYPTVASFTRALVSNHNIIRYRTGSEWRHHVHCSNMCLRWHGM